MPSDSLHRQTLTSPPSGPALGAGVVAAGEHGAQQKEKDLKVKLGSAEGWGAKENSLFFFNLINSPLPHPTPTVGALRDPALKAALEGERTSLEKCVSSLEAGNQQLEYEVFTLTSGGRGEKCCVGSAGAARAGKHR